VRVADPIGARPGDLVELELPPRRALLAIFLLFILPVLGLIASLVATPAMATPTIRAVYALGGMAAGLLLGTSLAGMQSRSRDSDLTITAVLGRASCSAEKAGDPPEEVSSHR
jgi:positive regulator of sigma E activity